MRLDRNQPPLEVEPIEVQSLHELDVGRFRPPRDEALEFLDAHDDDHVLATLRHALRPFHTGMPHTSLKRAFAPYSFQRLTAARLPVRLAFSSVLSVWPF
ncbi:MULTISPECIES: hypothetical protein [Alphaproteobacteria]|uniref:Uncharacterized protein n=2 Tax=Alphaproteobacteria TaxID=28211 RepID=A0A512HKN5_9HYPH|nr:hypothetical protein [Sphingomonas psychrolutea]GEO85970.1 hypothetical protein RNA01_29020 [Ciceribacter naphthalenivorans]GLR23477.1 hypothetical protein GCM10007920_32680 [Ciceribacter naphthalenivorans]GLT06333.1 hypothetical protein GCM10007926_32680 [Sphingomonas psychrolutea]